MPPLKRSVGSLAKPISRFSRRAVLFMAPGWKLGIETYTTLGVVYSFMEMFDGGDRSMSSMTGGSVQHAALLLSLPLGLRWLSRHKLAHACGNSMANTLFSGLVLRD